MRNKIDSLISEATKSKEIEKLKVLRLIKAELLKASKSGHDFDDNKILLKMADQRRDSIRQYTTAGRMDLVDGEQKELDILSEYLPTQPSENEIREYTIEILKSAERTLTMRDMKSILGEVQKKYPGVSGKIVSEELKKFIA
jgi:uncharacterized protein